MAYTVGSQPVYLLGSDSTPVTANTSGSWVTLPGKQIYRNIVLEGVPNGASVAINVRNLNRPSNVIVVTGPAGSALALTAASMLSAINLPGSPMQIQAVLSSAGASTSLRCYLI